MPGRGCVRSAGFNLFTSAKVAADHMGQILPAPAARPHASLALRAGVGCRRDQIAVDQVQQIQRLVVVRALAGAGGAAARLPGATRRCRVPARSDRGRPGAADPAAGGGPRAGRRRRRGRTPPWRCAQVSGAGAIRSRSTRCSRSSGWWRPSRWPAPVARPHASLALRAGVGCRRDQIAVDEVQQIQRLVVVRALAGAGGAAARLPGAARRCRVPARSVRGRSAQPVWQLTTGCSLPHAAAAYNFAAACRCRMSARSEYPWPSATISAADAGL
jgi:hypothetical protein